MTIRESELVSCSKRSKHTLSLAQTDKLRTYVMAEDSVNVLFLFLFFAFVLSVRQNQLLSQELKGSFDTNTFDDKN